MSQAQSYCDLVSFSHTLCFWYNVCKCLCTLPSKYCWKEFIKQINNLYRTDRIFHLFRGSIARKTHVLVIRSADQYADLEYLNPFKWHIFKRKTTSNSYSYQKTPRQKTNAQTSFAKKVTKLCPEEWLNWVSNFYFPSDVSKTLAQSLLAWRSDCQTNKLLISRSETQESRFSSDTVSITKKQKDLAFWPR